MLSESDLAATQTTARAIVYHELLAGIEREQHAEQIHRAQAGEELRRAIDCAVRAALYKLELSRRATSSAPGPQTPGASK